MTIWKRLRQRPNGGAFAMLAVPAFALIATQADAVPRQGGSAEIEAQDCADATERICTSRQLLDRIAASSTFSVAVFPLQELMGIVDPEVAHHLRQRIQQRLVDLGYNPVALERMDAALAEMGVTHAEELSLLPLERLADAVRADAFIFGLVEEAGSKYGVVYNGFAYRSSLKLESPTGDLLWYSAEDRIAKRRFALDPFNAFVDIALTRAKSDVRKAAQALVDRMLESLPPGPVRVIVGDDWMARSIEVGSPPK